MAPRNSSSGAGLLSVAAATAFLSSASVASAWPLRGGAGGRPSDAPARDLLAACTDQGLPELLEEPPDTFDVVTSTTAGSFTIRVVTAWAPPFARRFWALSRLSYMEGARFYRVDRVSDNQSWVVQFGYRGDPAVDQCWDEHRTDNSTWSVAPPGNVRGTVGFSMDAVDQTGANPNCTAADYCAQGFSTNIYINYGNNSWLDAHGFAIFGTVLEPDMEVVDRLYSGYGEMCDLCPAADENGTGQWHYDFYAPYCKGYGAECQGVNTTLQLAEGEEYYRREKPLLDRILEVSIS